MIKWPNKVGVYWQILDSGGITLFYGSLHKLGPVVRINSLYSSSGRQKGKRGGSIMSKQSQFDASYRIPCHDKISSKWMLAFSAHADSYLHYHTSSAMRYLSENEWTASGLVNSSFPMMICQKNFLIQLLMSNIGPIFCHIAASEHLVEYRSIHDRGGAVRRTSDRWLRQAPAEHVRQSLVPRRYVRRHIPVPSGLLHSEMQNTGGLPGLHRHSAGSGFSRVLWSSCERRYHVGYFSPMRSWLIS